MSYRERFYWGFNVIGWAIVLIFFAWLLFGCAEDNHKALAAPPGLRCDPAHYGTVIDEAGLTRVSIEVIEDGIYDLKYQACVVNNHTEVLPGVSHNILAQANLFVNDSGTYEYVNCLKSKGFNISHNAHYGVLTLLWVGPLYAGDIVEVQVRAQSGRGLLPGGAIIIDVQPEGYNPHVWETFAMYRIDEPNTPDTIFLIK